MHQVCSLLAPPILHGQLLSPVHEDPDTARLVRVHNNEQGIAFELGTAPTSLHETSPPHLDTETTGTALTGHLHGKGYVVENLRICWPALVDFDPP